MTVDVSVIITSYNVAPYIARAIHSALGQTGVSVEAIVVDDCSTDGTWNVISSITDPRLTRILLPQNGGPSVARNAGIAAAKGNWIAVLDGDDAFDAQRLENCLRRAKAASADIVVDNLTVVSEVTGAETLMFPAATFSEFQAIDLAAFIRGNQSFLGGWAFGYLKPVFSAAFLKKHNLGYDPTIRIGEDYLLMAEALAHGAACAVEQTAGYRYTVRTGSISHRLTPADVARIADCDRKFLARHTLAPDAAAAQRSRERHLKQAYAFNLLIDAIKKKNIFAAVAALRISPTALWNLWRPISARINRVRKSHA